MQQWDNRELLFAKMLEIFVYLEMVFAQSNFLRKFSGIHKRVENIWKKIKPIISENDLF
jgi:hypothetical protein